MDVDEFITAGLYDPAAENAEARLALLRYNRDHGITIEDMVEAERDGRLAFVAEDPLIRPGSERLTLREGAARAGVSMEEAIEIWRAAGFPDPTPDARVFSERDVEMIGVFRAAEQIFGREATLQLLRVFGAALARMAEAECTAFVSTVRAPIEEAGGDDLAIAKANVEVAQMLPRVTEVMDVLHRHHIETAVRRFLVTTQMTGLRKRHLAIGFADLVGYTAFSSRLSDQELSRLLVQFETECRDIVMSFSGWVVKLIGDEVMFAAPDAVSGCRAAVALVERFGRHEALPQARAGVAVGEVVSQDGDYYGGTVNLAGRVAAQAPPGTVLVSESARRAADDPELVFDALGTRQFKGFPDRVSVYSARRGRQPEPAVGGRL